MPVLIVPLVMNYQMMASVVDPGLQSDVCPPQDGKMMTVYGYGVWKVSVHYQMTEISQTDPGYGDRLPMRFKTRW